MCSHGYFYRANEKQSCTTSKNINFVLWFLMSHSLIVPYMSRTSYRVPNVVFSKKKKCSAWLRRKNNLWFELSTLRRTVSGKKFFKESEAENFPGDMKYFGKFLISGERSSNIREDIWDFRDQFDLHTVLLKQHLLELSPQWNWKNRHPSHFSELTTAVKSSFYVQRHRKRFFPTSLLKVSCNFFYVLVLCLFCNVFFYFRAPLLIFWKRTCYSRYSCRPAPSSWRPKLYAVF